LGLLALSRENALVLAPVVALWLATLPGVTSLVSRAAPVGALALGMALVLVPVGLRNQSLGDRFLVTTSQLGPNLWIGNHPGATGRYEALRLGRGSARFEREDARALAVEAVGRELSPAEVSDYWRDRALVFMRDHPAEAARQLAWKAFLVVNARELPDTENIEAYADESLVLRALFAVFHFGVLAPLALVGLLARASDWRRLWLFPGMALAIAASVAVFYVFGRYRFTLVPVLMPLAAAGGVALWDAARAGARGRKSLVTLALAGAVAAAVSNFPLREGASSPGLTHLSVGNVLLEAGRLAEAQTEFERAVADLPGYGFSHARLADVLRLRGEYERSLASYDRALALLPTYPPALAGRGMALEALGRPGAEESYRRALSLDPDEPDSNNNLANILLKRGDARGALPLYERALAARPDDARILSNLGTAHLQIDDPRGALPLYERALAALPDDARMLSNLGTAHLHSGDPRSALPLFDRALVRDPHLASARLNRAVSLAALGRSPEARMELEALLAQEPPGSPYAQAARDGLAQLGAR
jgi:tetratricopeptide (TPR) repeat protein